MADFLGATYNETADGDIPAVNNAIQVFGVNTQINGSVMVDSAGNGDTDQAKFDIKQTGASTFHPRAATPGSQLQISLNAPNVSYFDFYIYNQNNQELFHQSYNGTLTGSTSTFVVSKDFAVPDTDFIYFSMTGFRLSSDFSTFSPVNYSLSVNGVAAASSLFTNGPDTVDFNLLQPGQQTLLQNNADKYHGNGGDDKVTLPAKANLNESIGSNKTLSWTETSASTFFTGSHFGDNNIVNLGDATHPGDANYFVSLGAGNDAVNVFLSGATKPTDTITGFTGRNTIDFVNRPNLTMAVDFNDTSLVHIYDKGTLVANLVFNGGVSAHALEPYLAGSDTQVIVEKASYDLVHPAGTLIDWEFIYKNEGGDWHHPYVPPGGTSGVTISLGVDLGAGPMHLQSRTSPLGVGIPGFADLFPDYESNPNLKFLAGALQKRGAAAEAYLRTGATATVTYAAKTPGGNTVAATDLASLSVSITQSESDKLLSTIEAYHFHELEAVWNKSGGGVAFTSLPAQAQTVIADMYYNFNVDTVDKGTSRTQPIFTDYLAAAQNAVGSPGFTSGWAKVADDLLHVGINQSRYDKSAALIKQLPGVAAALADKYVPPVTLQSTAAGDDAMAFSADVTDPKKQYGIDPSGANTFTLLATAGSPAFGTLQLPIAAAELYAVRYRIGSAWSSPVIAYASDKLNVPANVTGLQVSLQDLNGNPFADATDFTFFVTFATTGKFSGIVLHPNTTGENYNGHTYQYVPFGDTAQTWSQARDAAVALGGSLATVASAAENQFILDHVLAGHLPSSVAAAFIGASDEGHEGAWQWVTGPEAGSTFWNGAAGGAAAAGRYANWAAGEPNNVAGNSDGAENFGVMGADGRWLDVPSIRSAGATTGYIVEFSPTMKAPDFNGDDKMDLLFQQNGAVYSSGYEWQLNGRSLSTQGALDLYDKAFTVLVTGDFDGDGRSDLIFENPNTGGVWQWQLDGTGILRQGAVDIADKSFHLLGAGDFNGDLTHDLIWRNDAGFIYQWQMSGKLDTPLAVGPLDPHWHVVGAGDFDGDGKADLLLRNIGGAANENGALFLWQMNGNAIKAQGGIERPGTDWATLGTGDFDGDGKTDFAVRHVSNFAPGETQGAVWVYLMDGTAIKAQGAAGIAESNVWHVQEIGDLNGDGKDDILYRNDAGYFYSWNMDGTHIASEGLLQGAAQWADPSFKVVTQHWDLV